MKPVNLLKLRRRNLFLYSSFFIFIFFSQTLYAQKNLMGVTGAAVWTKGHGLTPIAGGVYERKLANRFSIETALNFYSVKRYTSFLGPVDFYRRHYLDVPVLLKFNSNVVNLSAGPSFDFYLGHSHEPDSPDPMMVPKKTREVGYLFRLSKSFDIKDNFVLEPGVSVGSHLGLEKPGFGIGVSLKRKF